MKDRSNVIQLLRQKIEAAKRATDVVDLLRVGLQVEMLAVEISNPFLVDAAKEAVNEIKRLREENQRLRAEIELVSK